jgi:hypothetical protein
MSLQGYLKPAHVSRKCGGPSRQALADAAAELCASLEASRSPSPDQTLSASTRDLNADSCQVSSSAGQGEVVLLSFSGMAQVLGWPARPPLTAVEDRPRVLASWARQLASRSSAVAEPHKAGSRRDPWPADGPADAVPNTAAGATIGLVSGGARAHTTTAATKTTSLNAPCAPGGGGCSAAGRRVVRLRTLPFPSLRSLPPEAFVQLLASDLRAAGVVAGRNYRFGERRQCRGLSADVAALMRQRGTGLQAGTARVSRAARGPAAGGPWVVALPGAGSFRGRKPLHAAHLWQRLSDLPSSLLSPPSAPAPQALRPRATPRRSCGWARSWNRAGKA